MAVDIKPIKDWQKILLDTTIIISLFNAEADGVKDDVILFIKKLVNYLGSSKTGDNNERIFYISTITLSELLTRENDAEKIKRILKVLNSQNVEFIDFDLEAALHFNARLYNKLSKDSLHDKAKEFGWKQNDYMMAREWINRDYMIIMSGVVHQADVILTADKKSFYPLTAEAGIFCALTYPDLFEYTDQFIIQYKPEEVEETREEQG